jgi:hypothetical protein
VIAIHEQNQFSVGMAISGSLAPERVHVTIRPGVDEDVAGFDIPLSNHIRTIVIQHHDDLAIFVLPVFRNKLQAIRQPVELFPTALDEDVATQKNYFFFFSAAFSFILSAFSRIFSGSFFLAIKCSFGNRFSLN